MHTAACIDDGGSGFFRNVGTRLPDYRPLYATRLVSQVETLTAACIDDGGSRFFRNVGTHLPDYRPSLTISVLNLAVELEEFRIFTKKLSMTAMHARVSKHCYTAEALHFTLWCLSPFLLVIYSYLSNLQYSVLFSLCRP